MNNKQACNIAVQSMHGGEVHVGSSGGFQDWTEQGINV
jgi:hypothetical protein